MPAAPTTAFMIRPLAAPVLGVGSTRWAQTPAEAELLLRRLAGQIPPHSEPQPFDIAVGFARGGRRRAEIALSHADAHREASLWEAALVAWANESVEAADQGSTGYLMGLAEVVRHVAHYLAVGEFVDVYENLDRDVDIAGAARRARVLASPAPTPLVGPRYREGRALAAIARDVTRDIDAAVGRGVLPEGLRCTVSVEQFEAGPGIEVQVVRAPGLWIPDLCEMCVPVAYGLEPPPEGGLRCGHTPSLGGDSIAADGVLLTVLAIGDAYNRDSSQIEAGQYVVQSAFELATCFGAGVGRAQRETLRSSENAMRDRLRRRAAQPEAAPPPSLPPGGTNCRPAEPSRTAP
jgi:hypothetical protein